jgi:hypothetical protein
MATRDRGPLAVSPNEEQSQDEEDAYCRVEDPNHCCLLYAGTVGSV